MVSYASLAFVDSQRKHDRSVALGYERRAVFSASAQRCYPQSGFSLTGREKVRKCGREMQ